VCSVQKSIPMGTKYYRCSVSTCNSGRLKLTFCSVRCWDIHVPEARHRDAGAVEEMARASDPRWRSTSFAATLAARVIPF
jgi:hypothetical protein